MSDEHDRDGQTGHPRRPRHDGEVASDLIEIAHLRGDLARVERRIVDLLPPLGDDQGQELARLLAKADELRSETTDLWDTLIEPFVAKYRAKPGMPPWPP